MPRFAVLRHDSPRGLHWDLLLELGAVLKTWALPQPPEPGTEIACEALTDHRPAYLDYEGPLSGQRGSVTRWDQGTYEILRQSDSELVAALAGERLTGQATLARVAADPKQWRFSFHAVV